MRAFSLRRHGGAEAAVTWAGPRQIVASGLGDDTGGGIYVLADGSFSAIDRISTTGLAVSRDGERLARLLWTDDQIDTPGEVLLYDPRGVRSYNRVDALHEPHSAAWEGDLVVAVSTRSNAVLWLDASGRVVRRWQARGDGDCWHLNSLTRRRGRLLVSAFGRFGEHRGWLEPEARRARGIVVDLRTGRDVLSGLSSPHNPMWLDGGWLVCNSADGELVRLDGSGQVVDRRSFDGWTRGLAFDEDYVYLGVSAHRLSASADGATACVVAMRRGTLEETERWQLPCREVYDVTLVPTPLVDGLTTGFRTNPRRVLEQEAVLMGSVAAAHSE